MTKTRVFSWYMAPTGTDRAAVSTPEAARAARAFIEAPLGHLNAYRLGRTLQEEVAACLLGGYGMPAEIAVAAFERLRGEGAIASGTRRETIEALLSAPLDVMGRQVRYRFAKQKAGYLAEALVVLEELGPLPASDRGFRDALLALPGVGPKTASWITRNLRASDQVAILDVHICRACEAARVFSPGSNPARAYFQLEARFIEFAAAIDVRASELDNLMWQTMRRIGHRIGRVGPHVA
jgi:thermostable 8-oxoguanine DNA glycosylase